nr:reverse transcriptase domain-containing protein [Tanacetum cinerariifolium]
MTEKIIQIKERLKMERKCVGPVTYRVKLPQELSCIHDTFHVSSLKKCLAESDVQVPLEEIEIDENMYFVEEPIEIVERDVKKLKRRRIPLVKVRWNSRQGAEYTWEREDQFQKKYPRLFTEVCHGHTRVADHAFDFFAVEPMSGLAAAPDNQNGWIEWDDVGNEEVEDVWDEDGEWLMASVMPLRATVTVPNTYEVGGPSTATLVGHPLTTMASRVATQPQVIDDLCVRMSNLEYRHGELVKKMVIVSDAEVANSITIWEIHPRKELNMRQTWWIELLSDYECEIKYHSGKANVVVDALSRKERLKPRRVRAMSNTIHSGLKTKILEAQGEASKDLKTPAEWL